MKKSLVICAAALAVVACETPNWEDPAWVNEHLKNGDRSERRMALSKITDMSDEQKKGIVPGLVEVYNAKGPNQKGAMQLLVELRDPAAKDVFLNELKTDETGYSAAAATALGEAKIKDALPEMLSLLNTTENVSTKQGIVQALKHMTSPEIVPPLLEILKLDVDNTPISLLAYTCEVLGSVAETDKSAFNDEAIKAITLAVFYGNNSGQTLDRDCGLTIQQIGPAAIPHLTAIFEGKRDDVQKLMLKYDTPKVPFPQNSPRLIASKRLTSLRGPGTAEMFVKDLDREKAAPENLKGQNAVAWRVKEVQITSEQIRGLGDQRAQNAVPLLTAVVEGKYVNEQWDDITDGLVELQFRQDAAYALNQIGDRKVTKQLLEVADKGVINDLEKRAAMLQKRGQPIKELERYQFNWMVAQAYANLTDGSDLADFEALIARNAKYKDLAAKYKSFLPVVNVAIECRGKGDAAAQGACYAAKLKDPKPEIRTKAAWEISRLPDAVASKILIDNLGIQFLDTREILVSSLYAHPSKDLVKKIDELLKKEENQRSPEYKIDKIRLGYLRGYAANNSK